VFVNKTKLKIILLHQRIILVFFHYLGFAWPLFAGFNIRHSDVKSECLWQFPKPWNLFWNPSLKRLSTWHNYRESNIKKRWFIEPR